MGAKKLWCRQTVQRCSMMGNDNRFAMIMLENEYFVRIMTALGIKWRTKSMWVIEWLKSNSVAW
jgi:hypothetical protein